MAENREMRWIPPKMIARVATASAMPTKTRLIENASDSASQRVLLCTSWLAIPNVRVMSTAKRMPIQR